MGMLKKQLKTVNIAFKMRMNLDSIRISALQAEILNGRLSSKQVTGQKRHHHHHQTEQHHCCNLNLVIDASAHFLRMPKSRG